MIDAKEMRLGNHIKYADHKVWRKKYVGTTIVIEIDIFPEILQHPDRFDPIPLTFEALEACGFNWETTEKKHIQIKPSGVTFYVGFYWPEKEFQIMEESMPEMVRIGSHIEYLHQLQNLYFSLTGFELFINIPIAQKSPV